MKTYKIDPLGKNRPLMLVRGTRLPESFPDSVAEHMAKSLKANCRGVFTTINGEISSSTVSPGVVLSKEANEDNNTLVVMTEGMQNESVDWEDNTGKQFRLEHAGRFEGSQYGGNDPYYTSAHKDLRTFVTGAVPYTGQPLVAANAKQWYSYTTTEGVALTFRGCIQAPEKGGTDFVGLKIDSINFMGSDANKNFKLTLDCDSAVALGLRNGMNDNSKPFNMRPGIGWLQIVATDDFKSHIKSFTESSGNGDAAINPYEAYDGFTYNVDLAALMTQPGSWVPAGNRASFGIYVKPGSALENSIIANASGYACESLGVDMSGSGDTFPIVEEVSTTLGAEPTVVNLTTDNRKQIVVIRFSSVQEGEQLHLELSDTVTAQGAIRFRSMNTAILGTEFIGSGDKSIVIDIPSGDDVFAFFSVNYNAAGTVTLSRTKEVVPTQTPGFYSADGQLIKAMTKDEVEQDYSSSNCPANTNEAIKNATSFVWPEGVTSIGTYAFRDCTSLTSVGIPGTVTNIKPGAFDRCSSLTEVAIPEGITSIGNAAFQRCTDLTSVTLPSTVTEIGENVFSGCSKLTTVVIPDGITSIGYGVLYGCSALTSVTIPEGVTSIGGNAFSGCSVLNPLTVPNTVTTIGNNAFKNVPKVIYGGQATGSPWGAVEVVAPQRTPGFYNAEGQLIQAITRNEVEQGYGYDNYPAKANDAVKNATNFVWPNGVTRVGANVFSDCTGLTEVEIPRTVKSVGESSFKGCTGLTSVAIPHGVTSIGMAAFSGCTALTAASIPNTVTTIRSEAFRGTKLTRVEIPQGVTVIDWNTFNGCTDLTSVTIPNTVTSIGGYAFNGCTGLNPLTVPNTVTTIGTGAFTGVPKVYYSGTAEGSPWGALEVALTPGFYDDGGHLIKSMTKYEVEKDSTNTNYPAHYDPDIMYATRFVWPEGVTKVGNRAFYDCKYLTSLSIPEGVTSIGQNAFHGCLALATVEIPNTVTSIGSNAFNGCSALTSVTIPSTVTSIEAFTFMNCPDLTSVTIPSTVTSIGRSAFGSCSSLASVTIPEGVTSIGDSAFSYCTSLNTLTVPSTVTTIGNNAFKNVPKVIYGGTATGSPWGALEVLTEAPSAQTPGFYSAEGQIIKAMTKEEVEQGYGYENYPATTNEAVKNATNFVWPDGVTKVGANVFSECTGLTSVTIPDGVTSIGMAAFRGCTALTTVTIPEGVTSIGNDAFRDTKLTRVEIPSTVTSIGEGAFSGCSGLTSVIIPNTVTEIRSSAFSGCSSLSSITIPEGVTSIGDHAFLSCTALTSVTIPNTVTSIGSSAFGSCTSLNPLTVPNTVTTIGNNAFKNVPKVIYAGTATGSPWGAVEVSAS